jgi:hypothetical protein
MPLRWGKWDGHALIVHSFGDEDRVLLGVSPSGDRLLTVTHDQDVLAIHLVADGSVVAELNADVLPWHPAFEEETTDDEAQAFFDYEGGFVDENTPRRRDRRERRGVRHRPTLSLFQPADWVRQLA